MKVVMTLILLVAVPCFALDTPIGGCVRKSGALTLIGPQYRRQACKKNETPITVVTRQQITFNSLPSLIRALVDAPPVAVVFTSTRRGAILDTTGQTWYYNGPPIGWGKELPQITDPVESISAWDETSYTTIDGDVHVFQDDSTGGSFINVGHP